MTELVLHKCDYYIFDLKFTIVSKKVTGDDGSISYVFSLLLNNVEKVNKVATTMKETDSLFDTYTKAFLNFDLLK